MYAFSVPIMVPGSLYNLFIRCAMLITSLIGIKNMAVVIDEMDVGTTFSEVCNGKEI